ncbi:TssA family type VI secretion system protein [Inquilinus sp. CA228]|uniref:TssA family type VI secretion system protein n=1 Tax=Inquilinus sp. CA228 TaxID=3455609 RepID=UPI003F8D0E9A
MKMDEGKAGLGSDPIPGLSAVGESVRYSSEFEALEAQIRLLDRQGPAAVDWGEVESRSADILRNRSKDILAAIYHAYACWRRDSFAGLAAGLTVLDELCASYWEDALPPKTRMRARIIAFEWLDEHLAADLGARQDNRAPPEAVCQAHEAFRHLLDSLAAVGGLDRIFGKTSSPLRTLDEQARSQLQRVSQEDRSADGAMAAHATEASLRDAASGADGVPLARVSDPDRAIEILRAAMSDVGLTRLAADPFDVRAYALLGEATWLSVPALPVADGGRTGLTAPAHEQVQGLTALRADDPRRCLMELERFCSGPGLFWLDGQRLIAELLARAGDAAQPALRCHAGRVGLALRRLDGLETLAFSDGQPFADAATRAWLGGLSAGDGEANAVEGPPPWETAFEEASALVAAGRVEDGFKRLRPPASSSKGRECACWLVAQLRLSIHAGEIVAAQGLARHLAGLVRDHRLDCWEPDLAADILEMACRCHPAVDIGNPERSAMVDGWMTRLAGLDLSKARAVLSNPSIR